MKWRLYETYFVGPGEYAINETILTVDERGTFDWVGEQTFPLYAIAAIEGSTRDVWSSQSTPGTSKMFNLILWILICTALGIAFMTVAKAELCLPQIDNTIEKRAGYKWLWRMVEGDPRKCWYYSNTLLPKEDLIWSYGSREFDADVRVIDRKFWLNPGEDRM